MEESTEFKNILNYSGSLCLTPMTYYEKNMASIRNLITGKQRLRDSSLLEEVATKHSDIFVDRKYVFSLLAFFFLITKWNPRY